MVKTWVGSFHKSCNYGRSFFHKSKIYGRSLFINLKVKLTDGCITERLKQWTQLIPLKVKLWTQFFCKYCKSWTREAAFYLHIASPHKHKPHPLIHAITQWCFVSKLTNILYSTWMYCVHIYSMYLLYTFYWSLHIHNHKHVMVGFTSPPEHEPRQIWLLS